MGEFKASSAIGSANLSSLLKKKYLGAFRYLRKEGSVENENGSEVWESLVFKGRYVGKERKLREKC